MSTHRTEVLVEQLHVAVDDLKRQQLVVVGFDAAAEVETGVPTCTHAARAEDSRLNKVNTQTKVSTTQGTNVWHGVLKWNIIL